MRAAVLSLWCFEKVIKRLIHVHRYIFMDVLETSGEEREKTLTREGNFATGLLNTQTLSVVVSLRLIA
jgi:fido (protein-threonine AMPylation protein)